MSAKEILLVIKAAFIQTVSADTNKTILTIALISLIVIGGPEKYSRADMASVDSSFGSNTITHDTETGFKWLDVSLSTPYSYDGILIELEPGGNFFDYTAGHRESGPGGGSVIVAAIGTYPDPTMTEKPNFGFVTSNNINDSYSSWLIAKPVFVMPGVQLLLLLESGLKISGTWTGSAGFGQLSFVVDSTSTGITEITYEFIEFKCGAVVRNGPISVSVTTPWPITDHQFTIENNFNPNFEMTLSGMFDPTGTYASGDWEAVSYGTTCSGSWDASLLQ